MHWHMRILGQGECLSVTFFSYVAYIYILQIIRHVCARLLCILYYINIDFNCHHYCRHQCCHGHHHDYFYILNTTIWNTSYVANQSFFKYICTAGICSYVHYNTQSMERNFHDSKNNVCTNRYYAEYKCYKSSLNMKSNWKQLSKLSRIWKWIPNCNQPIELFCKKLRQRILATIAYTLHVVIMYVSMLTQIFYRLILRLTLGI